MTKTEQIINQLNENNWKQVSNRSKKYRAFEHDEHHFRVFVGKRASVRIGETITKSISCTISKIIRKI